MSDLTPALNIYQRMIKVQKTVKTVFKNETVKMSQTDRGYKAVTHDDVAALLHEPLADAGIVLLPEVTEYLQSDFEQKNKYGDIKKWYRTDLKIRVRWINADKPEDFIESNGAAFALDSSDKGYAKAYSLALKIVLLKVHLLESRDGEEKREFEDEMPPVTHKPPPPKPPVRNHAPQSAAPTPPPPVEELDKALGNDSLAEEAHQHEMVLYLFETVEMKNVKKTDMPGIIENVTGRKAKSDQLSVSELQSVISFIKDNY